MRQRFTGTIESDQIKTEDQACREQVRAAPDYALHRFNCLAIAARNVIDDAKIIQSFRRARPDLAMPL